MGAPNLFVAPEKIDADVRAHLGNAVTIRDRTEFARRSADLRGKTVAVDPRARRSPRSSRRSTRPRRRSSSCATPPVLPKAIKNAVEIAGTKAAHARDGAALSRFLHWISVEGPKGGEDELTVRRQGAAVPRGDGRAGHAQLRHDFRLRAQRRHRPLQGRAKRPTGRVETGTLLLVDSGGQYKDGTTDITRTVAIGTPSDDMRHHFTLVLKGHIALGTAQFPQGTRGSQLDVLARQFLWAEGLDYAHGTGHGVGSFSAVHEGPQRIATFGGGDEPLQAGMILSNEPGYYKTGGYGIRIENLVLVVVERSEGERRQAVPRLRDAESRADRPRPHRHEPADAGRARLGRRLSREDAGDRRPAGERRGSRLAEGGLRASRLKTSVPALASEAAEHLIDPEDDGSGRARSPEAMTGIDKGCEASPTLRRS